MALAKVVMTNGLAKKAQGSGDITPGGHQEIHGLTCSISRMVQIFPLTFLIWVSPIRHRRLAGLLMSAKYLIQQRHRVDIPVVKRGVVNMNAALRHHLFKIMQTQ